MGEETKKSRDSTNQFGDESNITSVSASGVALSQFDSSFGRRSKQPGPLVQVSGRDRKQKQQ